MRTSNPALSESAFNRLGTNQGQAGYTQHGDFGQSPFGQGTFGSGPGTQARPVTERFTVEGAIYKTGILLAILIVSGLATALLLPPALYYPAIIGGVILGLVALFTIMFRPHLAKIMAPGYAVVEGVVLGAITVTIESQPGLDGIAGQAALGTVGVLGVMLFLYRTGVIQVTQRFRMVVLAATGAIFLTYLASFILGFFGIEFGFLHGNSMLSIGISLVVIGVAALNLALDFDFIERAAAAQLEQQMEWYAAFGLLVTLVWLYLEILRLLAKLQSRD
ncbi:Bax inhibitor-1/YccA family membrane protein [Euzebya tangerina]|uniref:Bax inhibitor-1/YccA family protein n=1 Tax=Euzebya tangerina TaxID=591198 RepID=UPI000E31AD31|nr:Bax inhibitor-1/YccA family protein [Euzebya tangerina]